MRKWVFTIVFVMLMSSFFVPSILADDDESDLFQKINLMNIDDDHDDDDDDDHDDHDDDDDDDYEGDEYQSSFTSYEHQWYFWEREVPQLKGELPIEEPAFLPVHVNEGKSILMYALPNHDELFVSVEGIGNLLGAEVTSYPKSRIAYIKKDETELVVRAGSNAAYENGMKTPMPAKALYHQSEVFIPISVAANSMGYGIEWDEDGKEIHLKPFVSTIEIQ